MVRPGIIAGETVFLVEPHYSGGSEKWTKDNLHFRSSIWDARGNLISASFPKFFNLFIEETGELRAESQLAPLPKSLKGWQLVDKKDGSTLILSKWKGSLIARTRGTFSYEILGNADEMEYLKEAYPKVFSHFNGADTVDYSLLFEWYSPRNKIVINYGDYPKLWLIGGIHHANYAFVMQQTLDVLSADMAVERPETYKLDDLIKCREFVNEMVGKEGMVMYPPDGQNPVKLKSPRYWSLHSMKEGVSSMEKVLDIWLTLDSPSYQSVYEFLEQKYDIEIAEFARGYISKIANAMNEVDRILTGFENFADKNGLYAMPDKEAYAIVSAAYGKTNRAGYVMNIKKGKELSKEAIKKLAIQVLK